MPAPAPEPMRRLAANLRRLMSERDLAPAEIAVRADVHITHLNPILRGERAVRLDTLLKLAGAVGVPPEELLAGIRWEPDGRGGGRYLLYGTIR